MIENKKLEWHVINRGYYLLHRLFLKTDKKKYPNYDNLIFLAEVEEFTNYHDNKKPNCFKINKIICDWFLELNETTIHLDYNFGNYYDSLLECEKVINNRLLKFSNTLVELLNNTK